MNRFAAAVVFALVLTFGDAIASDQTALLANATNAVEHMRSDQNFGPSNDLLHRARAVLIVPGLVKGGFFFGGEGGNGVMLRREGERWSNPAFYTLASGSFGLQIGLEKAELVMFIMSERALNALEQSKFKMGAAQDSRSLPWAPMRKAPPHPIFPAISSSGRPPRALTAA